MLESKAQLRFAIDQMCQDLDSTRRMMNFTEDTYLSYYKCMIITPTVTQNTYVIRFTVLRKWKSNFVSNLNVRKSTLVNFCDVM